MRIKTDIPGFLVFIFLFGMIVLENGTFLSKILKLLFVIFATIVLVTKKKIFYSYYILWLILFVLMSFGSIRWAEVKEYAISGSNTIFINSISIFMFIQLMCVYEKDCFDVFFEISFLPIIRFMRLLIKYGVSIFGGMRNINGIGYNTIGMLAGIGVIFLVMYYKGREKKIDLIFLIISFSDLLICLLSMSRKSVLYLVAPLLFYYLFSGKNVIKKIRNFIFILIIGYFTYWIIMNNGFLYEYVGSGINKLINYITNSSGDASAAGRHSRITYGLEIFKARPILGYGTMNYNYKLLQILHTDMLVADNNFVDLLVNLGFVGFTLYYSIYFYGFWGYFKKNHKNEINKLGLALLITLLISDYGVSSYLYQYSQCFLAIVVVMIVKEPQNGKIIKI